MKAGRVLVVGGSDSGGGAGVQADLKTVLALGGYGASAITALTVQDTLGVHEVMAVPAEFVRRQMEVVLGDIGADAVKTGMLGGEGVIDAVGAVLAGWGGPVVVDPVMVAKGGRVLLKEGAMAAMRRLIGGAALVTPNGPEAAVLLGGVVTDQMEAALGLLGLGAGAVLLKGGHFGGAVVRDVLATADGVEVFERARVETRHTHGTGCTLASGVAVGLAMGMGLSAAVRRARDYVQAALLGAPGLGAGHGPLGHGVTVDAGWGF